MSVNRYRYYIGPEGLLRALPGLPRGAEPQTVLRVPAAEHVSLSGRMTQDRVVAPVRRTWQMKWDHLTEDQEQSVQAVYRMSAQAPLRLLDLRKRNSLPDDVSTGGSTTRSVASFTQTGAGTLAYTSGGVPLDFLGILAGKQSWTGATATGTLFATKERHPIFSGLFGAVYTFSAYVNTTTSYTLSARPFDLLGVEQATASDAGHASTGGVWERVSWDYTPAAGVTSAYFGVTATGAGDIHTIGWMVQIDEALKDWTFGYGVPTVVVSGEAPQTYFKTKYHSTELALREV